MEFSFWEKNDINHHLPAKLSLPCSIITQTVSVGVGVLNGFLRSCAQLTKNWMRHAILRRKELSLMEFN